LGAGEEGIFHELIFYGSKTGGGGIIMDKGFYCSWREELRYLFS